MAIVNDFSIRTFKYIITQPIFWVPVITLILSLILLYNPKLITFFQSEIDNPNNKEFLLTSEKSQQFIIFLNASILANIIIFSVIATPYVLYKIIKRKSQHFEDKIQLIIDRNIDNNTSRNILSIIESHLVIHNFYRLNMKVANENNLLIVNSLFHVETICLSKDLTIPNDIRFPIFSGIKVFDKYGYITKILCKSDDEGKYSREFISGDYEEIDNQKKFYELDIPIEFRKDKLITYFQCQFYLNYSSNVYGKPNEVNYIQFDKQVSKFHFDVENQTQYVLKIKVYINNCYKYQKAIEAGKLINAFANEAENLISFQKSDKVLLVKTAKNEISIYVFKNIEDE